jgi:hypothetical protein
MHMQSFLYSIRRSIPVLESVVSYTGKCLNRLRDAISHTSNGNRVAIIIDRGHAATHD